MSELKTLKDLDYQTINHEKAFFERQIKQEAIKWVKEDKEVLKRINNDDLATWDILLRRWIRRFNITEEDLE